MSGNLSLLVRFTEVYESRNILAVMGMWSSCSRKLNAHWLSFLLMMIM
jgi:hypothetical protein